MGQCRGRWDGRLGKENPEGTLSTLEKRLVECSAGTGKIQNLFRSFVEYYEFDVGDSGYISVPMTIADLEHMRILDLTP